MNEFLSLFEAIPIYSFLERLAASGSLGQLAAVPLIMLLTALAVAIPALVIMGVVALIWEVYQKERSSLIEAEVKNGCAHHPLCIGWVCTLKL